MESDEPRKPVPVPARVSAAPLPVASPAGVGLPTSAQDQPTGHGSAGADGTSAAVGGPPTDSPVNEAVPVALDEPDDTARPARLVVGRSRSAVEPGTSW